MKMKIKGYLTGLGLLLLTGLTGCGGDGVKVHTYAEGSTVQTSADGSTGQTSADGSTETAPSAAGAGNREAPAGQPDCRASEEQTSEAGSEDTAAQCVVYVCGAVKKEGVYTLPEGSRVSDALKAAGGYAKNAGRGAVNLARRVTDGEKIRFPEEGEEPEESGDDGSGSGAGDGRTGDEGEGPEDGGTDGGADSRININTADAAELTQLPGIGATRAADILAYRSAKGSFSKPEDLMQVPGIKEGIYNKLKDHIRIQ